MRKINYRIIDTGTPEQPTTHIMVFAEKEGWQHWFNDVKDLEDFVGQMLGLLPRIERDTKEKK